MGRTGWWTMVRHGFLAVVLLTFVMVLSACGNDNGGGSGAASGGGGQTSLGSPAPAPKPGLCKQGDRAFVFTNYCSQKVWIGATGGSPQSCAPIDKKHPNKPRCPVGEACNTTTKLCYWTLPKPINNNHSYALAAKNGTATICFPAPKSGNTQWNGNLFGRTNCKKGKCQTGDCGSNGHGQCSLGQGPTGPTTLSEINLGYNVNDNYDVSIINGENVSMSVTPDPLPTYTTGNPYQCTPDGTPHPPANFPKEFTDHYTCSWKFDVKTITVPGTKQNYDESLMQYVAPYQCSSTKVCPTGLTCSNSKGPGYCQCTTQADCTSTPGLVCGLAQNTGLGTLAQVCGTKIGWLTADEVCVLDSSYGFPFNCGTDVSGNTTYSDLYGCAGTANGDCYNSTTGTTSECCGCPSDNTFTPNNPNSQYWPPLITNQKCYDSNQNWVDNAQPWLVFIKQACPAAYSFPDDDATTSFGCDKNTNYDFDFCPENAPQT